MFYVKDNDLWKEVNKPPLTLRAWLPGNLAYSTTNKNFTGLIFHDGTWYSILNNGDTFSSVDGVNYNESLIQFPSGTRQGIYANDMWVVADYSNVIKYSYDGIEWEAATINKSLNSSYRMVEVTYSDGVWFISDYQSFGYRSTDGINWTAHTLISRGEGGFVHIGSKWISGGMYGSVSVSTDYGITWTRLQYFLDNYSSDTILLCMDNINSRVLALAYTGDLLESYDSGVTWDLVISIDLIPSQGATSIKMIDDKIIIYGSYGFFIMSEDGGLNWEYINTIFGNQIMTGLVYDGVGTVSALARDGQYIMCNV